MNTMILLVALRLAGGGISWMRLASGAVFGAAAAWSARLLEYAHTSALWPCIAAGMLGIAAGKQVCRKPLYYAVCLLGACGLLGGVVTALAGMFGSLAAAYPAGCFCAIWISVRVLRRRRSELLCPESYIECRGLRMRAIIDSGNTLRDYLTGLPVIVLPEASDRAKKMLEGLPMRLIFADTAGGRQMMRLALPERITISVNERRRIVLAAVALAPALDAQSAALVPAALIDGDEAG